MKKSFLKKLIAILLCIVIAVPYSIYVSAANSIKSNSPITSTPSSTVHANAKNSLTKNVSAEAKLGGKAGVALINEVSKHIDNGLIKFGFNILNNIISGSINDTPDIKEIAAHVDALEKEVAQLEDDVKSQYEELYNMIITEEVRSAKVDLDDLYSTHYELCWDAYLDYSSALKAYSNNKTAENATKLQKAAKELFVNKLNIAVGADVESNEYTIGSTDLIKKIQDFSGTISDASLVSDKADKVGDHTKKSTYIKAIVDQASIKAVSEAQATTILRPELSYLLAKQTKLLVMYNESISYLKEVGGVKNLATAEFLQENFDSCYNLSLNSFNNAVEQSNILNLMAPEDVECTVRFNTSSTNVSTMDCYRIKQFSLSSDTDTFYIAKNAYPINMYTRTIEKNSWDGRNNLNNYKLKSEYPSFPLGSISNETFVNKSPSIGFKNLGELNTYSSDGSSSTFSLLDTINNHDWFFDYCAKKNRENTSVVDFLNTTYGLKINDYCKEYNNHASAILMNTPDPTYSSNNFQFINENTNIYAIEYNRYQKGYWLNNNIDDLSTVSDKQFNVSTKDIVDKNQQISVIPVYIEKKDTKSSYKISFNGIPYVGPFGTVTTSGTNCGDYYETNYGSAFSLNITPIPYAEVKSINYTKGTGGSVTYLSGTVYNGSDFAHPTTGSIKISAPYYPTSFNVEFGWIDLGELFDGSGTANDPYIICDENGKNDSAIYADLVNKGYPVKDYSFAISSLKGKGTSESPYIIENESQVETAINILKSGLANSNTVFSLDFLKGSGTESDPYEIKTNNDINLIQKLYSAGARFANSYFLTDFLEKNSTGDYIISTDDDASKLISVKKYCGKMIPSYYDPAFLNNYGAFSADGSAENPYLLSDTTLANMLINLNRNNFNTDNYCIIPKGISGTGTTQNPLVIATDDDIALFKTFTSLGCSFTEYELKITMFEGDGTEQSPYLIRTHKDYETLGKLVEIYPTLLTKYTFDMVLLDGQGTKDYPYLITCKEDFKIIDNMVSGGFITNKSFLKVVTNIDFKGEKIDAVKECSATIECDGHSFINMNCSENPLFTAFCGKINNLKLENLAVQNAPKGVIAYANDGYFNSVNVDWTIDDSNAQCAPMVRINGGSISKSTINAKGNLSNFIGFTESNLGEISNVKVNLNSLTDTKNVSPVSYSNFGSIDTAEVNAELASVDSFNGICVEEKTISQSYSANNNEVKVTLNAQNIYNSNGVCNTSDGISVEALVKMTATGKMANTNGICDKYNFNQASIIDRAEVSLSADDAENVYGICDENKGGILISNTDLKFRNAVNVAGIVNKNNSNMLFDCETTVDIDSAENFAGIVSENNAFVCFVNSYGNVKSGKNVAGVCLVANKSILSGSSSINFGTKNNPSALTNAAGVVYKLNGSNTKLMGCYNNGNIYAVPTADGAVGGIAGIVKGGAKIVVAYNSAVLDDDTDRIGMIIGVSDSKTSLKDCYVITDGTDLGVKNKDYTVVSKSYLTSDKFAYDLNMKIKQYNLSSNEYSKDARYFTRDDSVNNGLPFFANDSSKAILTWQSNDKPTQTNQAQAKPAQTPTTGDSVAIIVLSFVITASLAGVAYVIIKKKKNIL